MMRHVDDTIHKVRERLIEMWTLVEGQVERAGNAFLHNKKDIAHEVRNLEKLVDSYELIIDRECETFFALLNPVAVDMRLIISILKMNNDLERIGDFANGISKAVLDGHRDFVTDDLLTRMQLKEMFNEVSEMLAICKQAFMEENSVLAGKVFAKDDIVDNINKSASEILAGYLKENPEYIYDGLQLNASIRRVERIGDRCNNIAEDIVFYIEARVLKHKGNDM